MTISGFFYLLDMASCRIQNLKPPCAYNVQGVQIIKLLDFDDFNGFQFDGDDLYRNCLVSAIYKGGDYADLEVTETAKYTSTLQNGLYSHVLETFIPALTADTLANLHLGTKRRQLVLFKTNAGKYFTFGYEAGADLIYTNQTAEATGSLVTISANSIYPAFEVKESAISGNSFNYEFIPDFTINTYCQNG